jgi:hypothetical protein
MDALRAARPLALAVYIASVFAGTFNGLLLMVGWTALGLAFISWYVTPERPKQDTRVWALLAVIVISHLAAIPGSLWFGTGNWILTASAFYWLLPALVVFLIADARVFKWLIWIAVIHAGSVLFNAWWFWGSYYTNGGLTFNPNVAAGLLIVGVALVFSTGRYWWSVFPLMTAAVFTGSRGALLVLAVIILVSLITRTLSVRRFLWICAAVGLGMAVYSLVNHEYQIAGYTSFHTGILGGIVDDINVRWTVPARPDLYPHGVVEHLGLHNVPLRMAREAGIVAAAGWLVLSAWALTRCRYTPAWWLMVAVLLLSILDHYTWRVHLGNLWVLAAGLLLVRPVDIRPTPSSDLVGEIPPLDSA